MSVTNNKYSDYKIIIPICEQNKAPWQKAPASHV